MPKVIDDPVTRILQVTKKTILNRPGFSFTMEDIALQAEMSLPSIYSRFHGLSDLCYEVIRYSWAEETKRLKSLAKGCIDYKDLIITLLTFLHEFIVQYTFPFSKVKPEKKEEVEEIIQNTIASTLSSSLLSFGYRLGKDDIEMLARLICWKATKKGRSTTFLSETLSILNQAK